MEQHQSDVGFVYTNVYTDIMKIDGFDWDDGNWPKCGKHGVSRDEIEQVLLGKPAVMSDPHRDEPRMRAIGKTSAGRYVFLVFMRRIVGGADPIAPNQRPLHAPEGNRTL